MKIRESDMHLTDFYIITIPASLMDKIDFN